ncbi:hypothetical protein N7470_010160 [Penicillium chermesinum]|nr:hypothetical protein N7470_010160 [Penicillium chermesinum]
MSTQAPPVIPPRPSRSPQAPASLNAPVIPQRPASRRLDRSVSPMRDSYAPSPLNEWNGPSMSRTTSNEIARPPSVTIPSLGEEGIEYADLDVGKQTPEPRNVNSDLKLHAPRPSLPKSSAKAKVQAVTRTDSRQAAAAGVGSEHHEEPERSSRSLHSQTNSRAASNSSDRRLSAQFGEEHGFRVPMYPNAGDVQAPSPSPYLEQGSQRQGRNHNRTRSGRDSSLPPGSYGLHGHGVQHADKFEKAWYEKHPDEYIKEEGHDDLNKIVRGSGPSNPGAGTARSVQGTPDEEVGYIASDEYTHRLVDSDSHPPVESPLRQTSFPSNEKEAIGSPLRRERTSSRHADGEVIHIDDPHHHLHHPDGFAAAPVDEDALEDDDHAEHDEPILAADEVRPESAFLHPAISPTRGGFDDEYRSRTPSISHSRSNSRSTSAQGGSYLTRFDSRELHEDTHTPLEDVEEYEPLFPEEEDSQTQRPLSQSERFKKRPESLKHWFPSEDIWEDAPNSLQHYTTVSTPDLPTRDTAEVFETPEQEAARRRQTGKIDSHDVASHILESSGSSPANVPKRPEGHKQRFPSRDIWEDTPDSQQLVTTVEPATEELKSPEAPSKPSIPPRPTKAQPSTSPTDKRSPPGIPDRPKPQVPSRPAKSSSPEKTPVAGAVGRDAAEAPAVPKAKPAVPARPGGSKIAALKAGFLTDLNSRLQLGPQQQKPQPKEPESPAEKQPLSDARKGRARGPARRKPAVEKADARLPTIPEVKITESWNVWQVGSDGSLTVGGETKHADPVEASPSIETHPSSDPSPAPEPAMAPKLSKNIAGEPTDPVPVKTEADAEEATPPIVKAPPQKEDTEQPLAEKVADTKADTKEAAELAFFAKVNDTLQGEATESVQRRETEGENETTTS